MHICGTRGRWVSTAITSPRGQCVNATYLRCRSRMSIKGSPSGMHLGDVNYQINIQLSMNSPAPSGNWQTFADVIFKIIIAMENICILKNIESQGFNLWYFSTIIHLSNHFLEPMQASVTIVLIMHPCISSCFGVNVSLLTMDAFNGV